MTEYPILVADFTGERALTIICERCGAEEVIHADDILNEGLYQCPADTERARRASTEPRCMGGAGMKYEQGDRCEGCGKLGFWTGPHPTPIDGCCSRKCKLQAEYAASLGGRK